MLETFLIPGVYNYFLFAFRRYIEFSFAGGHASFQIPRAGFVAHDKKNRPNSNPSLNNCLVGVLPERATCCTTVLVISNATGSFEPPLPGGMIEGWPRQFAFLSAANGNKNNTVIVNVWWCLNLEQRFRKTSRTRKEGRGGFFFLFFFYYIDLLKHCLTSFVEKFGGGGGGVGGGRSNKGREDLHPPMSSGSRPLAICKTVRKL